MKFNSKEVHKYVEKFNQQLSSLKAFFTKYKETSLSSAKLIVEMNEELKKNNKAVMYDKAFIRTIK